LPNKIIQIKADGSLKYNISIPFECNKCLITSRGNVFLLPKNVNAPNGIFLSTLIYNPYTSILIKSKYTLDYKYNGITSGFLLLNGSLLIGNKYNSWIIKNPDSDISEVIKTNFSLESHDIILLPNNHLLLYTNEYIKLINLTNFKISKINVNIRNGIFINKIFYFIDNEGILKKLDFFFNTGFNDNWDTCML
jgi:hypothetical protein